MVDTGATHNFISGEEAKRLGLQLAKDTSKMKAVNSEARPIHGVAKDVELRIGGWKGTTFLSVVPLDDFQVILGMEFLSAAKAIPMPGVVSIMDEGFPCMVPVVHMGKTKVSTISALQLTKGKKKGEATYVAALVEEEKGELMQTEH